MGEGRGESAERWEDGFWGEGSGKRKRRELPKGGPAKTATSCVPERRHDENVHQSSIAERVALGAQQRDHGSPVVAARLHSVYQRDENSLMGPGIPVLERAPSGHFPGRAVRESSVMGGAVCAKNLFRKESCKEMADEVLGKFGNGRQGKVGRESRKARAASLTQRNPRASSRATLPGCDSQIPADLRAGLGRQHVMPESEAIAAGGRTV